MRIDSESRMMPHEASNSTTPNAKQRVDGQKAGEIDHGRRDDDHEAADEGLHDVPEGAAQIEVALLAAIEQAQRDELGDEPASRGDQHWCRGDVDGVTQPHRAHDQHQHSHAGEKDAVQQRSDDLGSVVAEGAVESGWAPRDAGGDEGKHHTADGGESVERVGDDAIEPE
jgi:hypothetical protein